jgi:hypothetical protein
MYNSAVVVPSLVPQQVVYTTAPSVQPEGEIVQGKNPPLATGQPTTIATEGMSAALEVQRDRMRSVSEQRPRMPPPSRKANGEKGLGRVFYLLEQMRQEVMEADRTSKGLGSDMKFMVSLVIICSV